MTKKILLASSSPRRIELMSILKIPFASIASGVDEGEIKAKSPHDFVSLAARAKAQALVCDNPASIIIGADTVVVHKGAILGKPQSPEEAVEMLLSFSASCHEVVTGLAVIDTKNSKEVCCWESTRVHFRQVSKEEVEGYVRTGEPMDKAGAYAIQGLAAVFVKAIEGCYFNVVGLPLTCLYQILTSFGVNIF